MCRAWLPFLHGSNIPSPTAQIVICAPSKSQPVCPGLGIYEPSESKASGLGSLIKKYPSSWPGLGSHIKGVSKKLEDSFLKQNYISLGPNSKVMVVLNRFCHAEFRNMIGWMNESDDGTRKVKPKGIFNWHCWPGVCFDFHFLGIWGVTGVLWFRLVWLPVLVSWLATHSSGPVTVWCYVLMDWLKFSLTLIFTIITFIRIVWVWDNFSFIAKYPR